MFGGVHLRRDTRRAYGVCHGTCDEAHEAKTGGGRSVIAASTTGMRRDHAILSASEIVAVRVGCVLGCTLFWTVVARFVFGG